MDTVQEFIPFAKEILSQKPRRGMVTIYLIGSILAFFGVVVGLVETVCHPFYVHEPIDEDLAQLAPLERRVTELENVAKRVLAAADLQEENDSKAKRHATMGRRNSSNRLHAS